MAHHILTGESLQSALNATVAPIKLCTAERLVKVLEPYEVALYVGNPGFQFEGTASRVRRIRQLDPNAVVHLPWKAEFEKCWRNTQAAAAWPWMESRGVPLALDGRPA